MICDCASHPQPDITLEGKTFTIILEPANQNVKGILRQKLKVEALTLKPKLLHGSDQKWATVLFDRENKHPATGASGLQKILYETFSVRYLNPTRYPDQFILFVLTHPNASRIPANGDNYEDGLSSLLGWAWKTPKLLQVILSLPQAKHITAEELGDCLTGIHDEKSLKLIFSHPNSIDIRVGGSGSLCAALAIYATTNNEPCAKRILRHPNIFKNTKSYTCLEHAMRNAQKSAHPEIQKAIQTVLDDIKVLNELKTLLETKNPKKNLRKIGQTFILLSARTQRLLYKALCEVHGRRDDTIVRDGMFHLVKKPSSLLPIITNLLG